MMQQYCDIKAQHPDALLFYRMGDFFELFLQDAVIAARELEITLTSRDAHGDSRTPMAGVPHQALENHVAKLVARGFKIVVCDQVEDPRQAKGLVKREVTRIITPGTLLEAGFLAERRNNYLAAVARSAAGFGLAYCDVSTGEFRATELRVARGEGGESLARTQLAHELGRIAPSEVLVPVAAALWRGEAPDLGDWEPILPDGSHPTARAPQEVTPERGRFLVQTHFQVASLEGFGLADRPLATAAAGAILAYLQETRLANMPPFGGITTYHLTDSLVLDPGTLKNLEVLQTARDGTSRGSLLAVLDHTQTAMGARCLRRWLLHPLLDLGAIRDRQEAVQELVDGTATRLGLARGLAGVRDLERLASRVAARTANARDLVALKESLLAIPRLAEALAGAQAVAFGPLQRVDAALVDLAERIDRTLVEVPPHLLTEGGLIRDGVIPELDATRELLGDSKDWLTAFEQRERERSGIRTLKVGYNKAFGYFIEVSRSQAAQVPDDFERKQTLTNAERYVTPALKDREARILSAQDRIGAMEYDAFVALREEVIPLAPALLALARAVAEADALGSLAEVAVRRGYVRPEVVDIPVLRIEAGRHPVVEELLPPGSFVPNDATLMAGDADGGHLAILTGPNMAGKSTFMRQVALIALMAQVGSFVPARSAVLGLVDRIFTRVGAVDDLATGQSTFMVEMNETANILNHASPRALIVLDEIGRGTSTFDGISIAWAVCEHLAQQVRARTLFATHYHELTGLAASQPGVRNFQMLVEEDADEVRFLRRVVPGGAGRSYGIEVARLAGLPPTVVTRARQVLREIERRNRLSLALKQSIGQDGADPEVAQLPLFSGGAL